jgi:hypothetical protein
MPASGGYVDMGNNFASSATFSLQAWIKTTPGATSPMWAADKHWAGTGGYCLTINNIGNGTTYNNFAGFSSRDSAMPAGGPVVNDGEWHQLVGVYNSGTSTLYVDGQFVASVTGTTYSDTAAHFMVGGLTFPSDTPVSSFDGLIDEVQVYNVALSASDVLALYEAPCSSPAPAMGQWWWVSIAAGGLAGVGLLMSRRAHIGASAD